MEDQDQQRDPRESLLPFITEARVSAFVAAYSPATSEAAADKVFTMSELRKFFDAYIKTCGDPLSIYVDDYLHNIHNFRLINSPILGEPVMPVKYNQSL